MGKLKFVGICKNVNLYKISLLYWAIEPIVNTDKQVNNKYQMLVSERTGIAMHGFKKKLGSIGAAAL